jgi:hypothetical protein
LPEAGCRKQYLPRRVLGHGRAFDLNALVRAADALRPHVTLFSAFRVNEWGQILVAARDRESRLPDSAAFGSRLAEKFCS